MFCIEDNTFFGIDELEPMIDEIGSFRDVHKEYYQSYNGKLKK